MIDFSTRFRRLRDTLQLNQEQMAARLHISANYLSQIENGREPSVRVLEVLRHLETATIVGGVDSDSGVVTASKTPGMVAESAQKPYGIRALSSAEDVGAECDAIYQQLLAVTGGNVERAIWLREQLRSISPPRHWLSEDKWDERIERIFSEMRAGQPPVAGDKQA